MDNLPTWTHQETLNFKEQQVDPMGHPILTSSSLLLISRHVMPTNYPQGRKIWSIDSTPDLRLIGIGYRNITPNITALIYPVIIISKNCFNHLDHSFQRNDLLTTKNRIYHHGYGSGFFFENHDSKVETYASDRTINRKYCSTLTKNIYNM